MELEKYVYRDPRKDGAERRTRRGWLHVVHYYRTPYNAVHGGGLVKMVKMEEAKHPSFLGKILAVILFPVSVIIQGAPEATTSTWEYLFDRRYGSFTSHIYYRKAAEV